MSPSWITRAKPICLSAELSANLQEHPLAYARILIVLGEGLAAAGKKLAHT
jgi:hypothetical protein